MEVPEHLHQHVAQNIGIDLDAAVDNALAATLRKLWAVVLGLRPEKDGNKWDDELCGYGRADKARKGKSRS